MRQLKVLIPKSLDLASVIAYALAPMGSLNASQVAWTQLLCQMGLPVMPHLRGAVDPLQGVRESAHALVAEAVPDESEPHPQRARVGNCNGTKGTVTFVTPGEVEVTLTRHNKGLELSIEFNRDSERLATAVTFGLYSARVPGAAARLTLAAAQAAAAEADHAAS